MSMIFHHANSAELNASIKEELARVEQKCDARVATLEAELSDYLLYFPYMAGFERSPPKYRGFSASTL